MEPRQDKSRIAEPRPEDKKKRFRIVKFSIVKLEERIAPGSFGNGTGKTCFQGVCYK